MQARHDGVVGKILAWDRRVTVGVDVSDIGAHIAVYQPFGVEGRLQIFVVAGDTVEFAVSVIYARLQDQISQQFVIEPSARKIYRLSLKHQRLSCR